jgi:1-acyl-sn-glycerol-3-phosphate acyltransferase
MSADRTGSSALPLANPRVRRGNASNAGAPVQDGNPVHLEPKQELRRRSRKAEIVAPAPRGRRLPKAVRTLQRNAPTYAMQGLVELSSRLRQVTGRDVIDLNRVMEIAQFAYQLRELSRRGANYAVDDFGFDSQWTESFLAAFKILYRDYWRVETTGIEHVPATGRALLVANHAGVLPWDGTMIKTAMFVEHHQPRHVRALVASLFMGMPVLSWFLRRTGQTVGHPDDTRRLLERDELVLVFPEGVKGTGKPFKDRYRLRRFGRGGFVATAIRTSAPIIPVSVVGSEEIYPMIADLAPIARTFGLPYLPLTPFWPWLGPLGLIPLPSKWRIQFHPPVHVETYPPDAADDRNLVMSIADEVRDTIQKGVYDNLKMRRGVFT